MPEINWSCLDMKWSNFNFHELKMEHTPDIMGKGMLNHNIGVFRIENQYY